MTETENRIEIDLIDFQISCRRFAIRATITRDRQLPVVDEFVLRLLAVLDRMSVARMKAWFGFSEAELETVLVDMGRRSLVEFDGDDVLLAPAGRDLFRTVPEDGAPRIVDVATLVVDVWFDLVSRTMVSVMRSRNADHLVRLAEKEGARDFPESFAREAFEENFRDYARRVRRFPDPDSVNLYSVSDVEGGPYGYQALRATLVLDLDRMVVRPSFPAIGDDVVTFQKLMLAANDAWQTVVAPESTVASALEFERMTGETRFAPAIKEPDSHIAWEAALKAHEIEGSQFRPTIGAGYLSRNFRLLLELVAKKGVPPELSELIWLRPNGSSWGRSLRLAEALAELRQGLKNAGWPEVQTTLAMPRSTQKSARTLHKKLFEIGMLLPQGHLPPNLEILFVPNVAAFVILHVSVGTSAVPMGGIVTDPKRLARIADRLRRSGGDGWEELWKPRASPAN